MPFADLFKNEIGTTVPVKEAFAIGTVTGCSQLILPDFSEKCYENTEN
ncbi:MAG: hypothetical protein JWQ71_988 [Pedosphaera sp.]|nr:hypothetical protein [Pedosphaera sp.]